MNQNDFVRLYANNSLNFLLFLGAGASLGAGIPLASSLIDELKKKYYCSEENQNIDQCDISNDSKSKYWYGYRPRYIDFLAHSPNSFVALGCLDSRRAFLLPVAVMDSLTPHMNTTPPDKSSPDTFYHIHVGQDGNRLFIYTHSGRQEHDITSYEI